MMTIPGITRKVIACFLTGTLRLLAGPALIAEHGVIANLRHAGGLCAGSARP